MKLAGRCSVYHEWGITSPQGSGANPNNLPSRHDRIKPVDGGDGNRDQANTDGITGRGKVPSGERRRLVPTRLRERS